VKNALILLASLIGAAATGCATGPTPIPDASSAGAQLYISKCGVCHSIPHPKRNSYPEWQHLLELMQQRMAEQKMPALTGGEKKVILGYLQHHAR